MRKFSEEELSRIPYEDLDGIEVIDTIEGEHSRWTEHMTTIFRYENKLYALEWERGLTEYQENEFYNQPYEVKEVKKMVEVTDYIPVKEGE